MIDAERMWQIEEEERQISLQEIAELGLPQWHSIGLMDSIDEVLHEYALVNMVKFHREIVPLVIAVKACEARRIADRVTQETYGWMPE